jgi:hypothetical protein
MICHPNGGLWQHSRLNGIDGVEYNRNLPENEENILEARAYAEQSFGETNFHTPFIEL